ncbi:MAG: hypothetical protein P8Y06_02195, partial [Patescibacteria group bacterium]
GFIKHFWKKKVSLKLYRLNLPKRMDTPMYKTILLILFPIIIFAQVQFIPISCDYASFHSSDSLTYLEIYVSTFQGSIHYNKDESGVYTGSFKNTLVLSDNSGSIDTLIHNYKNSFNDTLSAYKYNQLIDVFTLEVPYGSYTAKVEMTKYDKERGRIVYKY